MHLGGAEISLIGLLQALDPKKVDVDLFVYSHEGELMKLIPDYVNVLSEIPAYKMFERPMKEVLKKGYFDYEEHGFGPVVKQLEKLLLRLGKILNSEVENPYKNRCEVFFENMIKRIYNAIDNLNFC